jgi:TPR repeat protein
MPIACQPHRAGRRAGGNAGDAFPRRLRWGVLRAGLALGLSLTLAAPVWSQTDDGYAAYERGDYTAAKRIWTPLAERGDALAQYNLGLLYHHGLGVERGLFQAAKWYVRAAENGDADAQNAIGDLYVAGLWGKKDYAKAATWYELAAEQGHVEAQRKLGDLLARGKGVKRNTDMAMAWLRTAADKGDAKARRRLRELEAKRKRAPGGGSQAETGTRQETLSTRIAAVPRIKPGRKCPIFAKAPYDVNVKIEVPSAPINHDLSIRQLGRLAPHGPGSQILGLTSYPLEIKTAARYSYVPVGKTYCFFVTAVDVILRYPTMDIYVAKEYQPGSCPYHEILLHEEDHVRVARASLELYAPKVRKALTSYRIPTGLEPVVVSSPTQAKERMEGLSQELLTPVYREMMDALRKDQAALDTPGEYRRIRRRCRQW